MTMQKRKKRKKDQLYTTIFAVVTYRLPFSYVFVVGRDSDE